MKFSFALAAVALAAQGVLANIAITNPVAASTPSGGKKLKIQWQDDNTQPKVSDWGGINIFLAAGSQNTQYKLQTVASNLAVTENSETFTIDPSVGPSGPYYFIRMESTKLDSKNIPYMSFSARFPLDKMTGQFNATILAAAQGREGSASSTASSSASSSSATSMTRSSTSSSLRTTSTPALNSTLTSGASMNAPVLVPVAMLAAAAALL